MARRKKNPLPYTQPRKITHYRPMPDRLDKLGCLMLAKMVLCVSPRDEQYADGMKEFWLDCLNVEQNSEAWKRVMG